MHQAVECFAGSALAEPVGCREEKSGWGYVLNLDNGHHGASQKETLFILSFALIFSWRVCMTVIENRVYFDML